MATERQTQVGASQKDACANCAVRIRGDPSVSDGTVYCCEGCAAGGPCVC